MFVSSVSNGRVVGQISDVNSASFRVLMVKLNVWTMFKLCEVISFIFSPLHKIPEEIGQRSYGNEYILYYPKWFRYNGSSRYEIAGVVK